MQLLWQVDLDVLESGRTARHDSNTALFWRPLQQEGVLSEGVTNMEGTTYYIATCTVPTCVGPCVWLRAISDAFCPTSVE